MSGIPTGKYSLVVLKRKKHVPRIEQSLVWEIFLWDSLPNKITVRKTKSMRWRHRRINQWLALFSPSSPRHYEADNTKILSLSSFVSFHTCEITMPGIWGVCKGDLPLARIFKKLLSKIDTFSEPFFGIFALELQKKNQRKR